MLSDDVNGFDSKAAVATTIRTEENVVGDSRILRSTGAIDCPVRSSSPSFLSAWSRGELTREDLQDYARDYYCHVEAFARCLVQFARRLERGELRAAVLANLRDQMGTKTTRSHAELWLDFAEGIGAGWHLIDYEPTSRMKGLIKVFRKMAKEGTPEQTLAKFYVYESQVPRVSREKLLGLKTRYRQNYRTCAYFAIHSVVDVYHTRVWRGQLKKRLKANPRKCGIALDTAETAARVLWQSLDGIENERIERLPEVL